MPFIFIHTEECGEWPSLIDQYVFLISIVFDLLGCDFDMILDLEALGRNQNLILMRLNGHGMLGMSGIDRIVLVGFLFNY